MQLRRLEKRYAVCRVEGVPTPPTDAELWSLTISTDEISLVCAEEFAHGHRVESGWIAYRIVGPLPFTLVGVVAGVTQPLAAAGIPVFVVSTFDSDFVLVKHETCAKAEDAWRSSGFELDAPTSSAS